MKIKINAFFKSKETTPFNRLYPYFIPDKLAAYDNAVLPHEQYQLPEGVRSCSLNHLALNRGDDS